MLPFLTFPAINELPQSPASLCVLVMESQLSWLPVVKKMAFITSAFHYSFSPRAIVCLIWVLKDISQNGGSPEGTKILWVMKLI